MLSTRCAATLRCRGARFGGRPVRVVRCVGPWACPPRRSASSSAAGDGGSGRGNEPRIADVVPFRLTKDAAIDVFARWNKSRLLSPARLRDAGGVDACDGRFLPFFCFSGEFQTAFSGRVGHHTTSTVTTMVRGQFVNVNVTTTDWKRIRPGTSRSKLDEDQDEAQVYASYAYRRNEVEVLRGELSAAIPPARLRASPEVAWKDKAFDAWRMDERAAQERVLEHMLAAERRRVEDEVRVAYQADEVDLDVTITWSGLRSRTIYKPAMILSYAHMGREYRTFVCGHTGKLGTASVLYDPVLVAAAVAVPGVAGSLIFSAYLLRSGLFAGELAMIVWGALVVVGPVAAGLGSQVLPVITQWQQERVRLSDEALDQKRADWSRQREAGGAGHTMHSAASAWSRLVAALSGFFRDVFGMDGEDDFAEAEPDKSRARREYFRQQRSYRERYSREREEGQHQERQEQQRQRRSRSGRGDRAPTHYEILQVGRDATLKEIQEAFRKRSFESHPDLVSKDADKDAANARYAKILAAYQALRDPAKRAEYDRTLD